MPGWSLGQARGVQGSPDWMPGWGLQPGWRHAIRARGPGSGDTKISAVSPEPGCRDARRVCGWTSIVVGVHVFFTHQGNQSSSQCSLALLTHASKHNAVACSQPGHGGPGSLMRARPVGEDNQSGPKFHVVSGLPALVELGRGGAVGGRAEDGVAEAELGADGIVVNADIRAGVVESEGGGEVVGDLCSGGGVGEGGGREGGVNFVGPAEEQDPAQDLDEATQEEQEADQEVAVVARRLAGLVVPGHGGHSRRRRSLLLHRYSLGSWSVGEGRLRRAIMWMWGLSAFTGLPRRLSYIYRVSPRGEEDGE